jgi:hypothetical protein
LAVVYTNGELKARAFETLSSIASSTPFSPSTYSVAGVGNRGTQFPEEALVTVETQSVRWRVDGTAPTAAVGHLAAAGSSITVSGYNNIKNFKVIETTASGKITVSYFYRK